MFTTVLQRIFIGLGVIAALGILIHDTKFDKALALALPVASVTFGLGSQALDLGGTSHTHVERASLSHVFTGMPRVQPRDDRGYNFGKYFGRNNYFGSGGVVWPHA